MLRTYLGRALAFVSLLCVVTQPASALAFCRETTEAPADGCECPHEGFPLYWEQTPVPYALNARGFPGVKERDLRAVLARSFAHWTDTMCEAEPVMFSVSQLDETTTTSKEYARTGPNFNAIAQLSAADFLAARGDRHAFALTNTAVHELTGEIVDADIVFNGGLGPFVICPAEGCPEGAVDIENVATHEMGHFLGLAHSDEEDSTMECTAKASELKKRSLEADDEAGICAIYGPLAIDERDQALHPERASTGCGCRIAEAHATQSSDSLAFLAAAALLFWRRNARAKRIGSAPRRARSGRGRQR